MSSNITICSRCGKRTPTYTLQNYGWEEELEGMWTCAECLREVQSSQNRNFVTPRARRQQRQEPGAPSRPLLQRQNAFNFTRPQGSRRSISSNSAFNTWTPPPQSVSPDTHPFSSAATPANSFAAPEASQEDMDISTDEDDNPPEDADDTDADEFPLDSDGSRITYAENPEEYMYWHRHGVERWRDEEPELTFASRRSDSVSPSDFQDLSSVGVGSSAAASPMVAATSRPANPQVAQARRTKTEAVRELEAQIAAAHSYDIEATSVNRSASTYDVINMEDTRVRDALNERDEKTNRPKNIVFQRDDGSNFVVIPISHLYNLLHNPRYLNSTLYKCYNVTDIQLRFSQDNILTRWNGSLKFINARNGILPQTGGYFLKNDLIAALHSGHRFFIYHVHDDIMIGPMISADLISWTRKPSMYQITEYQGTPMVPFNPLSNWTMNSNELSGRDEDMVLEGAIHCGHQPEPMITFVNVAIRSIGRQPGIDSSNILSHGRRSGSAAESKSETQQQTRKGGRRKKKKRKTRRRKRNKKTKKKKKRRKTQKKRKKKHKKTKIKN